MVGDIHYHLKVTKAVFETLIVNVKKIKPNYIIIPGDIIETESFLNNKIEKDYFEYILKSLSSVAPLIITPGNHEIANYNTKIDRKETSNIMYYLNNLNQFPNIFFLNNNQIKIDNIMFTGFTPSLNYYYNYNNNNRKSTKK